MKTGVEYGKGLSDIVSAMSAKVKELTCFLMMMMVGGEDSDIETK